LELLILDKIKKQSTQALTVIWVSGVIAFILLSFSFFTDPNSSKKTSPKKSNNVSQKDSGNPSTNFHTVDGVQKETPDNQAFVFVNINRKFFLTKFVAYVPDQELDIDTDSDSTKAYSSNISHNNIVQRKLKYVPQKTGSIDFEIKKVPD
jgi:hypothetical protein